ncbi:P-loop containing nucleoside triphosphate hydrolase protein [Bombardia bombarda]|uniref:P-loop containing nucleoside triphosphate hydrolase protein n=1 Tax=Bombardia bombarda TaxID=252184 RepID=A0AA39XIS1_9PEZI|nr:P-loop containing nucleoside triphosphate hydrolase protein [Bombardia bombarda]
MLVIARPRASILAATTQQRSRGRAFSTSHFLASSDRRPLNFNSGFTSSYDPTQDAPRGPIFAKSTFGVPQFYPRDLKRRVDDYVVGQDRAKKTICSVIFNHYQGLRRRQQHESQDQRLREKLQRQKYAAQDREMHDRNASYHNSSSENHVHPVQGGRRSSYRSARYLTSRFWADDQYKLKDPFLGQNSSSNSGDLPPNVTPRRGPPLFEDDSFDGPSDNFYIHENESKTPQHVKIDKSNILLIGPTGVGKTYILETLSKKLNVPFTISDCNSFTQAGYIGQDVEACIERLLIEANYDIKATEHGIVVLDEFDKIAKREMLNGRDVGGEGVQQALLKLVEGTKVTVNVKDNRSSRPTPPPPSSSPSNLSYGGNSPGGSPANPPPAPGKVDQFTIDTTNILFVFCGAFVGLDKTVLRRVAKPSMGFGSEIRSGRGSSLSGSKEILPAEMYTHLPHQPSSPSAPLSSSPFSPDAAGGSVVSGAFTPLDLTTPADLQAFGFIPELIGRMHNICALSPLSLDELYRILTEPRNSLVAQYTALFETYPSRLLFTRRALYAIAERAARNETGARGLKMEMERVLAEPMFDAPTPYVLITERCVRGKEKAGYWGKDGRLEVERRVREEDEGELGGGDVGGGSGGGGFEELREAGQSGA